MTDTIKTGFANVPLKKAKKGTKKQSVENITPEECGVKLATNCGETAIFMGRLMHEGLLPMQTIIINCLDAVYAVEINPDDLRDWLATQENQCLAFHEDKLMKKWNKPGVSYRFPGIEPGDKITE